MIFDYLKGLITRRKEEGEMRIKDEYKDNLYLEFLKEVYQNNFRKIKRTNAKDLISAYDEAVEQCRLAVRVAEIESGCEIDCFGWNFTLMNEYTGNKRRFYKAMELHVEKEIKKLERLMA